MTSKDSKPDSRSLHLTRVAMACGALAPLPFGGASADTETVRTLLDRSELQARLFNTGQMERWVKLANPGTEFTLMAPFGGEASHGFDATPEHLANLAARFQNGTAKLEPVQTIVSDDIVVLVYIERQDIEVSGLPMQDWSLRVTQVFQRDGNDWKLMHRHADPLVRSLALDVAAALAAGRPVAETGKSAP
jgi:ketosteroid isomerase-like protein